MLDLLFGFNARLGRLQYILAMIGLAVLIPLICYAMVMNGLVHFPSGTTRANLSQLSWSALGWPIICTAAFSTWATFMIQAMRIRDIGWDPVLVIGGWIAIMLIDMIAAKYVLGPDYYRTTMGLIVNFVMTGILLFWPGNDA